MNKVLHKSGEQVICQYQKLAAMKVTPTAKSYYNFKWHI